MSNPTKKSPNQESPTKEQARLEAQQLGETGKQQASEVKDQAVDATRQVTDQAKQQAADVAGEAKDQIRGLLDTTAGELRGRAGEGQTALAGTVRALSDEMRQLTSESSASGPVAQLAGDLAGRGQNLAGWLEHHEPDDVLREVRRFAARKPTTFLALAAGAGLLAGRLARGTRELAQEDQAPQLANTQYPQRVVTHEAYPPVAADPAPVNPALANPTVTDPYLADGGLR
ncbi:MULTISPECIES: hypothetical protein [unclassified Luteococcus]|uniref:hypothetical protein n=1 Tax=unclassified Luteococcus TaxID=2639923 RepID=UPI00313BA39F